MTYALAREVDRLPYAWFLSWGYTIPIAEFNSSMYLSLHFTRETGSPRVNMVYETLCLVLAVAKTLGLYRAQRRTWTSIALSSPLLRDGEHPTLFPSMAFLSCYLRIQAPFTSVSFFYLRV